MPSSVTVDKKLRKRIKMIAAELDTTQGEVIEKAMTVFEKTLQKNIDTQNIKARKIMKSAAIKLKHDKDRQQIRNSLSKPGIEIDELKIGNWGELDED